MNKPQLPDQYDLSNGSSNTYLVEARHQLIRSCYHCGEFRPVLLDGTKYFQYFVQAAGHVQQIFPDLSAEQRELILTGIHPECWEQMIGDEESDDLNEFLDEEAK